jgi:hypothetical protein
VDAIRATEANTFIGAEAIDVGLADRKGTFSETITRLSGINRARAQQQGSMVMTNETPKPAAAPAQVAAEIQTSQSVIEAVRAASARIQAIQSHESAKGREALANHFAFNTDMSAEAAIAALAVSPAGASARATPSLADRKTPQIASFDPQPQTENISAKWDKAMAKAMGNLRQ